MAEDQNNEQGFPNPNEAPPAGQGAPAPADEKQARTWGMLCHLAALAGYVIPYGGNIIGPLVIWLIKKDEFPLVDREGKKALNFHISMTIYLVVATLLCFVIIGFIILPVLAILMLVCIIIASIKTSNGQEFSYPLSITFLK